MARDDAELAAQAETAAGRRGLWQLLASCVVPCVPDLGALLSGGSGGVGLIDPGRWCVPVWLLEDDPVADECRRIGTFYACGLRGAPGAEVAALSHRKQTCRSASPFSWASFQAQPGALGARGLGADAAGRDVP